MIKFLNVIIEIRDAVILFICILISFLLILSTDRDPGAPFRQLALNSVGTIGAYAHKIGSYFRLQVENKDLRLKNTALAYRVSQLENALLENIRLRKLLEFRELTDFSIVSAEVIGQNPQGILSGLVLNEGREKGIEEYDPVLTAEGLVGKIVRVDGNHSICQILLDRNAKVSAKIQRNRELGIVAWDGGNRLNLQHIAKTIGVQRGDVVVTSGYSQIFPEDIKIGVIRDVSLEKEGLFQNISIQPAVNFTRLEEVYIIKKVQNNVER